MKKYEHLLKNKIKLKKDPLEKIIGIAKSNKSRNALKDLKKLESDEL
ncbi:MAG: hypothetical protein ACP6IU_06540 [Candidatus Asgardarchaeia archaeon]